MMYVTRNENAVAAGGAKEYEERQARFLELLKAQPGFQLGTLLNSLGYPAKYTRLVRWDSGEARRAFALSQTLKEYLKANPRNGLFTETRPQEAYEPVVLVEGEGQARYAALVDWTIDARPGNAQAFESNRKALFELRKKHIKGFVANRLARFLGNPTRYSILQLYSSQEAFGSGDAVPEIREFGRAHPRTEFASTPGVQERYEVVQTVRA